MQISPFLHLLLHSPMEPRFKLRFSRIVHSSFASCRSRNLSDITLKPLFIPSSDDGSFRRTRPDPSEPAVSVASSVISGSFRKPRPDSTEIPGGRTCPPASPNSPSKPISEKLTGEKKSKTTSKKKKRKQRKQRQKQSPFCPFNSSTAESNFGGTWWYSSDDDGEDETETLFSSKSRSSDSSASRRRINSRRRRGFRSRRFEMGVLPMKGKVKDSFAVVKKSSDPYNDFRDSMVEMIVEKQIFSGEDLEQLLQCFLALNSDHHHNVILEVFTEIWDALFSDWGS